MAEQNVAPFQWDEIPPSPDQAPFVLLVEAAQGQGKTHLGCTFPQPIFLLDTENRGDKVAAKFKAQGFTVYRKVCRSYNDIRRALAEGVFPHFKEGTILFDSGSDLQTLAELEFLVEAKKDKIYPTVLWSKVFEKMDKTISACRDKGFYVVITARLKPEYQNDKPTGALVMEGYKRLPYLADIHLRLEHGQALVLKNGFRNAPTDDTTTLATPDFRRIVDELIVKEMDKPVQFEGVQAPEKPKETPTPAPAQAEESSRPVGFITDAQRRRLFSIAKEHGYRDDEIKAYLTLLGFSSSKEITVDVYDSICSDFETKRVAKAEQTTEGA